MTDQELDILAQKLAERLSIDQYTLSIADASRYFGYSPRTLYNFINDGKLIRSVHYLKVGRKLLIKREAFIKWMEEKDGCWQTG